MMMSVGYVQTEGRGKRTRVNSRILAEVDGRIAAVDIDQDGSEPFANATIAAHGLKRIA